MFLNGLMEDASWNTCKSLNQIAIQTDKKFGVNISKQGVDYRFNDQAMEYMQMLIGEGLSNQVKQTIQGEWLDSFSRVLIKDSTKFDISENLEGIFPGYHQKGAFAAVSIQYEFDIKSGTVNDLSIHPATRPDRTDAKETIESVKKGDLIIRDLGYSILDCFKKIRDKEASFLSRLDPKTSVYDMGKSGNWKELDYGKLYQFMIKNGIMRMEKQVCIGKELRLPVRMVIEVMPEEVISKRRRETNRRNRYMGCKTSDEYKDRSCFNIFITNVDEQILTAEAISLVYRTRWMVELVFKNWKGVFGIDHLNPMKYQRLMCVLYMRLLMITICWEIFTLKRKQLFDQTGKLVSLIKCMKTLQENCIFLKEILINKCKGLSKWIRKISQILDNHHWLEKKKNKVGLAEILAIKA